MSAENKEKERRRLEELQREEDAAHREFARRTEEVLKLPCLHVTLWNLLVLQVCCDIQPCAADCKGKTDADGQHRPRRITPSLR